MSDSAVGSRDDQTTKSVTLPSTLPILPISEAVIFPYMMVPLVLSDANLIKLADECLAGDKILGAFAQRIGEPLENRPVEVSSGVNIAEPDDGALGLGSAPRPPCPSFPRPTTSPCSAA